MHKEIRHDIKHLRESLLSAKRKLGPSPLTLQATIQWNKSLKEFEDKLRVLNNKQKVHVNLQKEVNRTLEDYGYGTTEENEIKRNSCEENSKTLSPIRKMLEAYGKSFLSRFGENGPIVNNKSQE